MTPPNRHERAFAIEKVEGYDVRSKPGVDRRVEFEKAKIETVTAYRRYLEVIESLTFEQYVASRNRKAAAGVGETETGDA